jgi:hypothetical protein
MVKPIVRPIVRPAIKPAVKSMSSQWSNERSNERSNQRSNQSTFKPHIPPNAIMNYLIMMVLKFHPQNYSNFSIPRPNRKFLALVLAPLYTFPSREISLEAKLARSVEPWRWWWRAGAGKLARSSVIHMITLSRAALHIASAGILHTSSCKIKNSTIS